MSERACVRARTRARACVCVCVCVPPESSPFYPYFDADNGIGLLEECLTDCVLTLNDVYVIMAGDLNSRTASNSRRQTHTESKGLHTCWCLL